MSFNVPTSGNFDFSKSASRITEKVRSEGGERGRARTGGCRPSLGLFPLEGGREKKSG